jgi:hypothetical protein
MHVYLEPAAIRPEPNALTNMYPSLKQEPIYGRSSSYNDEENLSNNGVNEKKKSFKNNNNSERLKRRAFSSCAGGSESLRGTLRNVHLPVITDTRAHN